MTRRPPKAYIAADEIVGHIGDALFVARTDDEYEAKSSKGIGLRYAATVLSDLFDRAIEVRDATLLLESQREQARQQRATAEDRRRDRALRQAGLVTEATMSNGPFKVCPECKRRFDLSNEDDAGEWYYGHDCETNE